MKGLKDVRRSHPRGGTSKYGAAHQSRQGKHQVARPRPGRQGRAATLIRHTTTNQVPWSKSALAAAGKATSNSEAAAR